MEATADSVGFHADANQIIALEAVQGVFSGNSHYFILRFFAKKDVGEEKGAFTGGFAISTVFLNGKLWCFCGGLLVRTWWITPGFPALKIFHFFELYFRPVPLADVHEVNEQTDGDGSQHDQQGDAAFDPPFERS